MVAKTSFCNCTVGKALRSYPSLRLVRLENAIQYCVALLCIARKKPSVLYGKIPEITYVTL